MKHSLWIYLFISLSWLQCSFCWTEIPPTPRRPPTSAAAFDGGQSTVDISVANHDWHIWKAADRLEERMKDHQLTPTVISILKQWARQWNDQEHLLNNNKLLHEIEESMVALGMLIEWMDNSMIKNDTIVLMDICCGKGICSLLASYIFKNDSRVSKIVMMDRPPEANNKKNQHLDWSHIEVANEYASEENRPTIEAHKENLFETDKIIDWLSSPEQQDLPLAFLGIHLCKNLSPTFIGIANTLGPSRVPFLCLAPCCLPRVVIQSKYKDSSKNVLQVAEYEAPLQRQARLRAAHLRRNAQQRRTTRKCFLCQSTNHTLQNCDIFATASSTERSEILEKSASLEPCWKCGEIGHKKQDCPSKQASGLPTLILKPMLEKDVSHIMHTENPFAAYCYLLSTTIERDSIQLFETGLVNTKSSLLEHGTNWNRERKTTYIVATN